LFLQKREKKRLQKWFTENARQLNWFCIQLSPRTMGMHLTFIPR